MTGKLQTHGGGQKGIKEHEAPGIGTDLNGKKEENGSRKANGTILTVETKKMLEAVRVATLVRAKREILGQDPHQQQIRDLHQQKQGKGRKMRKQKQR